MKYYTATIDPAHLVVVARNSSKVNPGECRVRKATKEELAELDRLLGPVNKSAMTPRGGVKGIYALQEPRLHVPRNPAREAEEAKERAKKKAAFRAAMMKNKK